MAGLIDDKAAESEEEEVEEEEEQGKGKRKGKEKSGEESEDEDSSEEDEGPDGYEDDGFIVDEDDEEVQADQVASDEEANKLKKKKKKRRREEAVGLDEEDYELLEENTGIRRARPSQHRRIKKARDMEGAQHVTVDALKEHILGLEDEELEDDIEDAIPARAARGGREGGMGAPGASRGGTGAARGGRSAEGAGDGYYDEDDWLVHEDEEDDGPPGERRLRRRAIMASMPGVDADAMEEAQDIFGDVGDLLALYESRKREAAGLGDEDDYEGIEAEELSDEEAAEELRLKREERRREAAARRMQEQLDPEAMARHFMLPTDEKIRDTDLPEREQLHRGLDPQEFDLGACAQWIWENLLGDSSCRGVVRDTLEDGCQEVEGPPPVWYGQPQWHHHDLKGEPHGELRGQRGLFKGRDREGRKAWRHNTAAMDALRTSIRNVLQEIYERHNEVPFVGMYRKEICGELLATCDADEPGYTTREEPNFPRGSVQAKHRRIRRWDILWTVHSLAQRWRELVRRKEARRRAYQRAAEAAAAAGGAAESGGGEGGPGAVALQRCVELLQDVRSQEGLDDVEAKYQLASVAATAGQQGGEEALSQLSVEDRTSQGASGVPGRRRPQKSSAYALCRRAGLGDALHGIGLTAEQFADNVDATYKRQDPQDPPVSPEEYAARFVNEAAGFGDAEAVLRGIVLVAAAELGAEPVVRQYVRELYWETAVVSTQPTPAGETGLDPFHPLGGIKRLSDKPLRAFEGSDQFLRVLQAEKEGLVRVSIGLAEPEKSLLGNLVELYCSGGAAALSKAWDALRRRILQECLSQHLLPGLEREARAKLAAQARAVVAQEAGDRLWEYASQAPLQVRLVDEEDFVPDRRVMAAVYGDGQPTTTTTFVMLDPAGNLVDFLHCPQLSGHIARQRARMGEVYDMFSDPKKSQDAARLRSFIEDHKPHVVVLGASHPEARVLEADLKAIRDQILLDNPNFFIDLGTGDIATQMADESVAALWGASAAAAEEFPASPDIVRRAVALGRQMLDPLALLASLCGPSREVLALKLHPLQGALPEEERLAVVDRVLATAVAQVGVDLNAVAATPWLQAPLQFVPGLGPRKAAALLRAVTRSGGYVESRNQVWRELGVMGNRVFRNCGAYLRIRPAVKGMANLEMDPLDDTRVHPESYTHAIAIAQSAVAGGGDEAGEVAVENALARPQDVECLDLEAYAAHLASEGAGNKLATLIDIQQEFVRPYGELRRELVAPTDEEIFWLCSGETPDTLRPGRKVEARVRYVTEDDARCVLPDVNGLEAVIRAQDVSSSAGDRVDCRDYLKNGDTVTARILAVDAQKGLIELTTRSKDLNDEARWEEEICRRADKCYHVPTAEETRRQEAERRRQQNKRNFVARPIRHPLFKNLSMHEAASELLSRENAEPGEAIFRPHPRGPHMLVLTLLLPDRGVQHIDIKEGAKAGGAGSHLALGSPLSIDIIHGKKTEKYDDLDEVAARYLEPVQALMHKLAVHRKFRKGGWDELQEALREEKRLVDARMATYLLAGDQSKPGLFYLGFIASQNPHREYFTITPDGFHFRQRDFSTVDQLIAEWKKRPYGAQRQMAAQAPAPPAPPPAQQDQQAAYQQQAQYAGYYNGQYGQYQQDYQGYAATQAYQEPGEYAQGGGGGQYGYGGAAAAPGGYPGYDTGGQQGYQGYEQGYGAQQQYGQQYGDGQQPPPPPALPPQHYGGPGQPQQWQAYQGAH